MAKRVALKAYLTGTTTPATGKTVAITISKNGGAYANPSAGTTNATEISNGSYYVDLSTTDTGTLGPLMVLGVVSGIDNIDAIFTVADAHNAGFDGVPSATAAASGGLPTVGSSSGQLNPSGGKIPATLAAADVTGNVPGDLQTIKTQTVTCAAGVTVGAFVGNATHALTVDSSGNVTFNNTSIATVTTVTNQLTAAQIATGIWQDTTSGDFTVASSIGKSLYTSGNAPGAASGLSLVGSSMGTVTSVSGSVGSVTGAVGSVTGNVGGNVVGSVGSVTGTVGGIAGTTQTLDALQTALSSTHGAGSWTTATGFSTPTDINNAVTSIESHGDSAWATATGFATSGQATTINTNVLAIPTNPLTSLGSTAPANWIDAASVAANALNGKGDWATVGAAMTLTSGGYQANATELLDLTDAVETGLTVRQSLRALSAALAGVLSGAGTTTITIQGAGVATDRITATVDANGNRSAITLNL